MPALPSTFWPRLWMIPRAWHLSSLDAPTLAITWCLAFAKVAHVHAMPTTATFLGLVTWLCYVGDRLLDARSSRDPSRLRARHRFYGALWQTRRAPLLLAITLGALVATLLALRGLPRKLVVGYAVLTMATLAYFTAVHAARESTGVAKEAVVGFVFAVACVLPSAIVDSPRPTLLVPATLLLGVLAWLNCVLIERWEGHGTVDERAHKSTRWASRHVTVLLPMGVISAIGLAGFATSDAVGLSLCLAAAFAILAVVERNRRNLSVDALRILADAALLTRLPWLFLRGRA